MRINYGIYRVKCVGWFGIYINIKNKQTVISWVIANSANYFTDPIFLQQAYLANQNAANTTSVCAAAKMAMRT